MSRNHSRFYRLDELEEGDGFEFRDNGVSYFGTVSGEEDVQGIGVLLCVGRGFKRENWPAGTLVQRWDVE